MELVAAVIVVSALAAMASGRADPVLALMVALLSAAIVQVAPFRDLVAGLASPSVVTVAAMLVIAKGVVQTGVVTRATWALMASVTSTGQALRRLIPPMGVASALINTTPLVAMLIPAARELEQTRRVPAGSVLLPVTHATTLAGTTTLIGSGSNLVLAGIAATAGVNMTMWSFAPVAVPVALVGWVMIYLTARRIGAGPPRPEAEARDWRVELPVSGAASAVGRSAASLGIGATELYRLEAIERFAEQHPPETPIQAGDVLVFAATEAGVEALWRSPVFGMPSLRLFAVTVKAGETGTLRDFTEDGSVRVVAAITAQPFRDSPLVPGATCYVAGESIPAVASHDVVGLWQVAGGRAPQPRKTWIALVLLAAVVAAASSGLLRVELAASTGAVLMVLSGVLRPRSAVRALDLRLLFVLGGSIGLGTIVTESGLADTLAHVIERVTGGSAALAVVVLAVVTAVMTNVVTNSATASILTPVALGLAAKLELDPHVLLALVATCVSFTLLTPYSHQSSLMVMRPGGYTTRDFARFGWPLFVVLLVAASAVAYTLAV